MSPGKGQAVCQFQRQGRIDQSRLDFRWAGQTKKIRPSWSPNLVVSVAAVVENWESWIVVQYLQFSWSLCHGVFARHAERRLLLAIYDDDRATLLMGRYSSPIFTCTNTTRGRSSFAKAEDRNVWNQRVERVHLDHIRIFQIFLLPMVKISCCPFNY